MEELIIVIPVPVNMSSYQLLDVLQMRVQLVYQKDVIGHGSKQAVLRRLS